MADELKTVEKMAEDINKSIEGLKESIDEKANLDDLETRFDKINDKLGKLVDKDGKPVLPEQFGKFQEQLDDISTKMKQLGELQDKQEKNVGDQLSDYLKSDDYKTRLKDIPSSRKGFETIIKTADITTSDINSGTIETQTDVGVSAAPWRNTPIWDNVNKGTVGDGRDSISWWEETTRTDSAEMVAEDAKPAAASAKTWTKQSMDIKRIFDYTKASREALEDWEYTRSEILDLLNNGIPRKRETQLLSGTGLTVYLKGITEYAKTFAKPANFELVPGANEGDVLAAAILQCQNGNTSDTNKRGYMPNLILLNPGDKINMRLLKSTVYSYVAHPMLSLDGNLFNGARLVESLDLAAGQFIVGDFARAKAFVKRNMAISFHYENEDDALYDRVLVLASMRIAGLKVTTPDAYAFVTGTFAAGKVLITAV